MNVIFTCGGTAGHVNPALALAGYMQERHPDLRVLFVGTPVPSSGTSAPIWWWGPAATPAIPW